MKIQKNSKGIYSVTIPKDLMLLAKWEKGDVVVITPAGNNVMQIRKV